MYLNEVPCGRDDGPEAQERDPHDLSRSRHRGDNNGGVQRRFPCLARLTDKYKIQNSKALSEFSHPGRAFFVSTRQDSTKKASSDSTEKASSDSTRLDKNTSSDVEPPVLTPVPEQAGHGLSLTGSSVAFLLILYSPLFRLYRPVGSLYPFVMVEGCDLIIADPAGETDVKIGSVTRAAFGDSRFEYARIVTAET